MPCFSCGRYPGSFSPGDILIKQGDEGDAFWIVESGQYDIYVYRSPEGDTAPAGDDVPLGDKVSPSVVARSTVEVCRS